MNSIIVFSPHPDDAVLGCGGTIIKAIQANEKVYIVFLTDGRACYIHSNIESELTPDDIAKGRKNEAIESSKILGVPEANLIFFEIWDRELSVPKNFNFAIEKAKELILKVKPYRVFGPVYKNRHPDHQATHDIIKNALKNHPNVEFAMYGLQKVLGKSNLKIQYGDLREQKAKAMFKHKIELVYEDKIYEILAQQTKERFRIYKNY